MKNFVLLLIMVLFLADCNSGTITEAKEDSTATVIQNTDSSVAILPPTDTVSGSNSNGIDSSISVVSIHPEITKSNSVVSKMDPSKNPSKKDTFPTVNLPSFTPPRFGILGYSYFKNMRQNETRKIFAYLDIINSTSKIVDTLKEINSDIQPERENDTASVFTENMLLYKFIKVDLIDPDNDFVIKQIHDSSKQEIYDEGGNNWSWAVTPKTKKIHTRLTLRVSAEKPKGDHDIFKSKDIPIDITVDPNIFRSIYMWLYDNPDKTLAVVIIPLVVFFRKQIVALFKKKPKPSAKT